MLILPAVIDLPYVVAGQGGSALTVAIRNDGDADLAGLSWTLSGDPALGLDGGPTSLAVGESGELVLRYAGSPSEAIASATLSVTTPDGAPQVPVFGVAGDPGLGAAAWESVTGPGGVVCGAGATVAMPAAPYPDPSAAFTDPSVRVFVPEGYRDRGAQDLVVHFHGWSATVAATLVTYGYQGHVYASGSNAVLVVPQGPVHAQSGDFGKLMRPGGLARLITEVLVLLYREGKIAHPAPGELVLTSHSGGYKAVVAGLDPENGGPPVRMVVLFDSLYGDEAAFEGFARAGGLLRSSYTKDGGTLTHNGVVAAALAAQGQPPADAATQRALRDAGAVVSFAATTHDGTPRLDGAYGEALRWRLPHGRRGPRVELREAAAQGDTITVRWLAPTDEDLTGFVVERSEDGAAWSVAAETGAAASEASFPAAGGARVRIRPVAEGVADALPTDTYRADPAPGVLVVDGFDRVLDGTFGGLFHDFAAIVGEAAGAAATVSRRAITEDGFALGPWPAVIWLLGDTSSGDQSLSPAEQTALRAYVDAGGRLVVSGSEVAWDLGRAPPGAAFLAHCFGARFVADDAGSRMVTGLGPLAGLPRFGFGGPGAPYAGGTPDALAAAAGGQALLGYGSGKAAAVGVAGRGVIVGFPLELVDGAAQLHALVRALLAFVGR